MPAKKTQLLKLIISDLVHEEEIETKSRDQRGEGTQSKRKQNLYNKNTNDFVVDHITKVNSKTRQVLQITILLVH